MNQEELKQRLVELISKAKASMRKESGLSCDMARNFYFAEFLIANGVTIRERGEWIPVTERLPERFTHIIVCDENGMVGEAYHFEGGRFEWLADEELAFATHWMPLPEPPEAEKGGAG